MVQWIRPIVKYVKLLLYFKSVNMFLMALHMMKKRILVKIFLVVGFTLIISGLIFVAQSNSVIGPKSSFMYSNPKWTVNGFAFSIVGLVVLICGLIIHFAR